MAALEKIRSKGKIVMVIVFVALLCFVIGDFLSNSSAIFNAGREQVGEVCGKKMNYMDFQKSVNAYTSYNKLEGKNPSDAEVRNEAWQTFIITNMLEDQMEKIGMSISPEELEYVTKVNPHRELRGLQFLKDENGNFSTQRLNQLLQTVKQIEEAGDDEELNNEYYKNLYDGWLCVERKMINSMAYEKLVVLASTAARAPKAETDLIAKYASDQVDFACAFKPYFLIPDSTFTVTDEEGRAQYEKIKNTFKTDKFRSIKAIVFDVKPGQADSVEAQERTLDIENEFKKIEDIDEAYSLAVQESDPNFASRNVYVKSDDIDYSLREFAFSAKKDSVLPTFADGLFYKTAKVLSNVVSRPDSVKISIIFLTKENNAKLDTKKLADSIFGAIKQGSSFADLAEKFSMDNSQKNKGEFGWLREGMFGKFKDFDETAFNGKVGQVFQMEDKDDQFGRDDQIIVKIDSMTAPVKKVKIAEVAIKVEASGETYRKYYEKASKYISENSNVEDFTNNAAAEGLFAYEYSPIFENDYQIRNSNIENARKVVSWAFSHEVGDVTTQPFEFTNQCVIAALTGIVEKGFLPYSYSYANEYSKRKVLEEKKAEATISEWKDKDLAACSERIDTVKDARFDVNIQDPAVLASIYSLGVGETSAPIKGLSGVYKVKVLGKKPVEGEAPFNNQRREVETFFRQSMGVLLDKSDIVDNRSTFY
ncbi:MAG: SurA N-terminal domain-containing protein [Paludibacteraceae bacterium]|nr:SurA N-terminal domain-containing protein [Paludibacteraceae bacterium]